MSESALLRVARCDDEHRAFDIVFIHGLNGDARKTWEHPKEPRLRRLCRRLAFWKTYPEPRSRFWPDWVADEFLTAGIWSLRYPAASTAWRGHAMSLPDRATNVLQLFHLNGLGQRPILIVAHSLGGLLSKQILKTADSLNNADWATIGRSITGILFLATPHAGATLATFVDMFRIVTRRNWTINDLKAHEPYLRKLNVWFRDNFDRLGLHAHVLSETRPTRRILVVNATSADPGIAAARVIAVDKNHINICKPRSPDDQVFLETRKFLEDCVSNWKIDLRPRLGSIRDAREAIRDAAAIGSSYQAFPELVVPRGTIRDLGISLAATGSDGPVDVIKWVVRYADTARGEQEIVVTDGQLTVDLPGPMQAAPIGVYTLLSGTPTRISFSVATPIEQREIEWTPRS